jgi:hypothetical protein
MPQDYRLRGFNFNIEVWDEVYETLAICRTLEMVGAAFKVAIRRTTLRQEPAACAPPSTQ